MNHMNTNTTDADVKSRHFAAQTLQEAQSGLASLAALLPLLTAREDKVEERSADIVNDRTFINSIVDGCLDLIKMSDIAESFSASDIAEEFDASDIAEGISAADIAQEFTASDIACELEFNSSDIAQEFSVSDIACEFDVSDIACEIAEGMSTEDIAYNIDMSNLAEYIDTSNLAPDPSDVAEYMSESKVAQHIDLETVSIGVAEILQDSHNIDERKLAEESAELMMSNGTFVDQLSKRMLQLAGWQSEADRKAHAEHQLNQQKHIDELKAVNAELRRHLQEASDKQVH
jgi:hypothetical protein